MEQLQNPNGSDFVATCEELLRIWTSMADEDRQRGRKKRSRAASWRPDDPSKRQSVRTWSRVCPGNCGFAITWHATHCCETCCETPGQHSGWCERVGYVREASSIIRSGMGGGGGSSSLGGVASKNGNAAKTHRELPETMGSTHGVACGDGIRIPTSQWNPGNEDAFKARADEVMARWRENNYNQQGMVRRRGGTGKPNLLYDIDFEGRVFAPRYDYRNARITYAIRAVGLDEDQFQDYTAVPSEAGATAIFYHGTRDAYVAACCRDGLKSSPWREKIVGLWTHDTESLSAFQWGYAPLDALCGCYFHVLALAAAVRERRKKSSDGDCAVVVCDTELSSLMPIRAIAISFRIPSPQLESWRGDIRDVCWESICFHGAGFLVGLGAKRTAFKSLWAILQHGLLYDTHAMPTGRKEVVHIVSSNMAAQIGQVFRQVLLCPCVIARRQRFRELTWEELPVPFRTFLQRTYVGDGAVEDLFRREEALDPNTTLYVRGLRHHQ